KKKHNTQEFSCIKKNSTIHYHSPFILKEVIKLKYTIAAKTFVTLLIILFVFLSYVLIKVVM
ncbi:TPA: hypothetical protein ACNZ8B_005098, partial [Enterobacter kobei]